MRCRMNLTFKSQIFFLVAVCLWGRVEANIDSEDYQVPLLPESNSSSVIKDSALHWKIGAANDALKAGFSSLASRLYLELMSETNLSYEIRPETILNLVTALISEGRYDEALQILESYPDRADSAFHLRQGLLAFQRGNRKAAEDAAASIAYIELSLSDQPWYYLLNGLIQEANGNQSEAISFFDQARDHSMTETQRAQFEAVSYRSRLVSGFADETLVADLKAKLNASKGERAGYQFARAYATALEQMGRKEDAILVLEEQLKFISVDERDLEDQLLLLLGLIAGEKSDRGKSAFQTLLREGKNRNLQKIGLLLLAREALANTPTNNFKLVLDDLIAQTDKHSLLDELYFFRALIFLESNRFDLAESDANSLLEQFPGSVLNNSAIRLLAYISWKRDPPQYRTTADYLNKLRAGLSAGQDRWHLAVLMADCYYLNLDYDKAVDAYNLAISEMPSGEGGSRLLFQQVMASIKAGRIESAIALLDDAKSFEGIHHLNRWKAEWNLINEMKSQGKINEAFSRLHNLLGESETVLIPPELKLRLMWLEAQLSIEVRQAEETPLLADRILNTLNDIPDHTITDSQRDQIISQTLLIKGQALYIIEREDEGRKVFADLREQFLGADPTILSYLFESRYFAAINRIVDAQQRLIAVVDRYPESKYAPMALWEAAIYAERRGLNSTYQEAVAILERLINDYPQLDFIYHARLRQADISRKLNDFGTSQLIYEGLISQYPQHPERYRAEISLADSLLAQSSQNPARIDEALAILERLVDLPNLPVDLGAEAGFKWGFALSLQENYLRSQEVYWQVITRFLMKAPSSLVFKAQGRYWLSRSIFELGTLFEKEERYEDAREIYKLILDYDLPGLTLAEAKIQKFSSI